VSISNYCPPQGLTAYLIGIQAGSIFVDAAARAFIHRDFKSMNLDEEDTAGYTKAGVEHFAELVKPNFNGTEGTLDIKIGARKLNLPRINVQGGRMKVSGYVFCLIVSTKQLTKSCTISKTVKSFFDVCVDQILRSAVSQSQGVPTPVSPTNIGATNR
jgi:hypothetical protein